MKKITLSMIEEHNVNRVKLENIRHLQRAIKDCHKIIVTRKKELARYIANFDRNTKLVADLVKGEVARDEVLLNFVKLSIDGNIDNIQRTRKLIAVEAKHLSALRAENNALFAELLDEATDSILRDKSQTIELNRTQARTVFNKLYDLFDSGKDFEKVTIHIGQCNYRQKFYNSSNCRIFYIVLCN